MNKAQVQQMRTEIKTALSDVAKKYGMDITKANATYNDCGVDWRLSFSGQNSSGNTAEEQHYADYASMYGMKSEWLGQNYKDWNGDEFTLVGMKSRRQKYQFLGKRVSDGRTYKFMANHIVEAFSK